jgi:hypothetical protein
MHTLLRIIHAVDLMHRVVWMFFVAEPHRLHQQLKQLLSSCDAAGLSQHLRPPDSIHVLSQAVHLGAPPETLMQLLDGSLGLAATAAQLAAADADAVAAAHAGTLNKGIAAGLASAAAGNPNVSKDGTGKVRAGAGKAAVGGGSATAAADSSSSSANVKDTKKAVEVLATVGIGLPYLPLVGESASWMAVAA